MQIESLQHSSRILTGLHGTERNRWNEGRGKKARGTGERKELVRVGPSIFGTDRIGDYRRFFR